MFCLCYCYICICFPDHRDVTFKTYWTHNSVFILIRTQKTCFQLAYCKCNESNSSSSSTTASNSDNETQGTSNVNSDQLKLNELFEIAHLQSGAWYQFTLKCTECGWKKHAAAKTAGKVPNDAIKAFYLVLASSHIL